MIYIFLAEICKLSKLQVAQIHFLHCVMFMGQCFIITFQWPKTTGYIFSDDFCWHIKNTTELKDKLKAPSEMECVWQDLICKYQLNFMVFPS